MNVCKATRKALVIENNKLIERKENNAIYFG